MVSLVLLPNFLSSLAYYLVFILSGIDDFDNSEAKSRREYMSMENK